MAWTLRWRIAALVAVVVLLAYHNTIELRFHALSTSTSTARGYFHFLVPATSSNEEFCKLLLSGIALGYPTPAILNFDLQNDLHTAKVSGLLRFLNSLEADQDQRLALFVDAYDVWLQLPPSTLISRYYSVIENANKRLATETSLDHEIMKRHNIYNSIVFNAEKVCFPGNITRPECLGLPESTVSPWAYGPLSNVGDDFNFRAPRWLNSGLVMGPVRDLRRMLQAAVREIEAASPDELPSDQYHLANLYGRQEAARSNLAQDVGSRASEIVDYDLSNEYHITIDYTASMFQTTAFDTPRLGWVVADGTEGEVGEIWDMPKELAAAPSPITRQDSTSSAHAESISLVEFDNTMDPQPVNRPLPLEGLSWRNVMLGANVATKQIWSMIHFTVDKDRRYKWWNRMWFFPYGKALVREAERTKVTERHLVTTPDGKQWWSAEGVGRNDKQIEPKETDPNRAGVWAEDGRFLSWQSLCGAYEELLFRDIR